MGSGKKMIHFVAGENETDDIGADGDLKVLHGLVHIKELWIIQYTQLLKTQQLMKAMKANKELGKKKDIVIVPGGSIELQNVKQVGGEQGALALGQNTVDTV